MSTGFVSRAIACIFTYFFLICLPVYGKDKPSLQEQNAHIAMLVKKAKSFYGVNTDSMISYGRLILEYSEANNNESGKAEAYNIIAYGFQDKNNFTEAIVYYKKGIEIARAEGDIKLLSAILLNKGNVEEGIGNYVTALKDFLESVKIKEQTGDSLGIAKCLNNIAQIYSRQGNNVDALKTFSRSLEIKKHFGDSASIARTHNNIGVLYNDMKQHENALRYLTYALQYYENNNLSSEIGMSMGNIALTYDLMGAKDTALIYYKRTLEVLEKDGELYDLVVTRINTASLLLEFNELEKAEALLQKGLNDAIKLNSREDIREAYKYLAILNGKQGNFKEAYEYQQKFQAVSDSILNAEKAATLAEMHVKYESEKKDEQNKVLMKENEIKGILLERNRILNIGLIVLLVLAGVIGYLFNKQIRLSARQQATELEQKVLRSQMNPHFIFNSLQSIQGFIFQSNPLEAGKYLSDFSSLMRLILENSKTEFITLTKEVETLKYYLLLQQLRFANKMEYELNVDEHIDTDAFLVPPMLLQPCIENSIEHGIKYKEGKGKVLVSMRLTGDYFTFVVEDDGVGRRFKPGSSVNGSKGHQSLATIITKERVELFNKKSSRKLKMSIIDLEQPSGTKVIFEVPVKEYI